MQDINELIIKYQEELDNLVKEIHELEEEIPKFDLNTNLLSQLNPETLEKLEIIIPRLGLLDEELELKREVFTFLNNNPGLDLENLIIKDSKLDSYIIFLKTLVVKVLKYKKNKIENYLKIKDRDIKIITNLTKIKELLQDNKGINLNYAIELVREIPLEKDELLKIMRLILEHNLEICKQVKGNDNLEKEEVIHIVEPLKKQDEYTEMIDTYIRKCVYTLDKLKRDNNYQDEKYICESSLNRLLADLKNEKEYYELALEDETYEGGIAELRDAIDKIVSLIDEEIDNYYSITNQNQELDVKRGRKLLIITPTVRDLDQFKKAVCSASNIKDMHKLLLKIKNDEILYGAPLEMIGSVYPVKRLKVSSSIGGTPRLFYQIIDNMAIVLMLGIEGRKDYTYFKQSIEGRIKSIEYKNLVTALRLGNEKPSEKSPYNSSLTNKEYLDSMLEQYEQTEKKFFEKFRLECYDSGNVMR